MSKTGYRMPIWVGIDHEHTSLKASDNVQESLAALRALCESNDTRFFLQAKIEHGWVWKKDESGQSPVDYYPICAGTNAPYHGGNGYDWSYHQKVLGGRPYGFGIIYGMLNWSDMQHDWDQDNITKIFDHCDDSRAFNVGIMFVDLLKKMLNETLCPDIRLVLEEARYRNWITRDDGSWYLAQPSPIEEDEGGLEPVSPQWLICDKVCKVLLILGILLIAATLGAVIWKWRRAHKGIL